MQELELNIRKMKEDDLKKVLVLENACFSNPWSEKSFKDAICSEHALYLIAETGGKLLGYCGFFFAGGSADLCNMLVAEEMRNLGVGDRLLKKGSMILKEKKIEEVILEVRESNAPAIHLYQKNGFEKIGVRKNYYEKPKEDALLMRSSLFH